jgi:putative DNA methylase
MTEPRRKLIEVALPVEAISVACRRDKDRKVGTIKNVHKWFAPMPTPAWRALLFATLVDDPGDPDKRAELNRIIERLVPADGGPPPADALAAARSVLKASGPLPVVLDPFCGGGSTIVEAQRLGLAAVASDLNPVPVLITRTLAELIPQVAGRPPLHPAEELDGVTGGPLDGFVRDLQHYALRVRDEAWKQVGHMYPQADDGTVIGWLWARTVTCPNPTCRIAIPMYATTWLSKRKDAASWLEPVANGRRIEFKVGQGSGQPHLSTKVGARGARFRCVACGEVSSEDHVRAEARAGRMGLQMLAYVTDASPTRGYHAPNRDQEQAADVPIPDGAPDVPLPDRALSFRVQLYGMTTYADLYTARQLHTLGAFADTVAAVPGWVLKDGGDELYGRTIATVLGLCVGKLAQTNSTQARWYVGGDNGTPRVQAAFGRHNLPMVWDFVELNPFSDRSANWMGLLESLVGGLRALPGTACPANVVQCDARVAGRLVAPASALVATDPPYFSQIGYADLSDYFYVWERRALRDVHPDLFGTIATPKDDELIATPYRHGGDAVAARQYFVDGFTTAFKSLAAVGRPDLPMVVIYAHRQEESDEGGLTSTGWDGILEALLNAGFGIVGTWPIHGTGSSRQIGLGTNALASYIAMVCRPRPATADVTDRLGFLRALRSELPSALRPLQEAAIPPLDLTQAAIGPGMAVFSRYARVLESSGEPMSVRTALGLINQVRSEVLSEQEDEFDRDTRWAIQWFDEYAFDEGPFGRAEVLFTSTDTSLEGLRRAGIVGSRSSKVWLLPPEELPVSWDPSTDTRTPVWEVTMHLLKRLDTGGEAAAAELLSQVGGLGDFARDLSYRLADICERKSRPKLALGLNALIASWPEIARRAAAMRTGYRADTLL